MPLLAFAAPLAAIVLVQQVRFGYALFLGWDTSTYAWWANLVKAHGAPEMILRWNYPNLYPLLVAALGSFLGGVDLPVRILPLVAALPLGYAYFRLTCELTSNRNLGFLAAILGGFSSNTLRLVADLHRNLLAYSVALLLGAVISKRLMAGGADRGRVRRDAIFVWLPVLAFIAYTHIETYGVLALTLLMVFLLSRRWKVVVGGFTLLAVPLVVIAPLLVNFLRTYGVDIPKSVPPTLAGSVGETLLFLGGFALPIVAIGLLELTEINRSGNWAARYLGLWILSLAVLIPPTIVVGLQSTRLFFMFPVPVVLALGVIRLRRLLARLRLERKAFRIPSNRGSIGKSRTPLEDGKSFRLGAAASLALALLLVLVPASASTLSTTGMFLQPYVSEPDVQRLRTAAALVREAGYEEPIVVFYGPRAADFAPIYRAYFGTEIPDSLSYYGKLQFVFTLPPPEQAFVWKFNPSAEQVNSVTYRAEILSRLGTPAAVSSHAIVVAGGSYDRPFSESFIARFERSPGVFIIPPGALTPEEIDRWRLFAFSDGIASVPARSVNASWSTAPKVLEWVDLKPEKPFEAAYTISLARSWSSMRLTVRLWDWNPSLSLGNNSSVALAPLVVYVDGSPVFVHRYAGLGPTNLTIPLGAISTGLHKISFRSWESGLGIAVRLDEVEMGPGA